MKALIRGKEVMTEPFSPWVQNNIAFLTGQEKDADGKPLKGDGWTLVENYIAPVPTIQETPGEDLMEEPAIEEVVVIGGKTYKVSELRSLLNSE